MPARQTRLAAAGPLQAFFERASFLFFAALCVALLIFGKINPGLTERTQAGLADFAAPILEFLSVPINWTRQTAQGIGDLMSVRTDNARLIQENELLLQWHDAALRLDQENQHLRQLLSATERQDYASVTSRVVGEPGGPFLRAVLIGAGRRDGVNEYQPVMDAHGLVGRVVTAGRRSSRVLLLSDLNSRVPVRVGLDDHRGVLAGDNSRFPKLSFLPFGAKISVGDRIRTSGDGLVFPPDLPVGEVVSVAESGARVQLFSDLSRLTFVRVLAYIPPQSPQAGGGQQDVESEETADVVPIVTNSASGTVSGNIMGDVARSATGAFAAPANEAIP